MADTIPSIIPLDPMDRPMIWFETISALMIQLELKFEHEINEERLAKAVLLTLDSEPVLGCRLVDHWRKPYWMRLESINDDVLIRAASHDEYGKFKEKVINPYSGPQMRACLYNNDNGASLLIKVTHHAADAAGVRDVARVMSENYARLKQYPDYKPEPNLTRSENAIRLLRVVPQGERRRLKSQFREYMKKVNSGEGTFRLSIERAPVDSLFYIHNTLIRDQTESLTLYGRQYEATLNDVLISAFFRAQAEVGGWDGQKNLRITTTIDLRRHLEGKQSSAVANLSLSLSYWPDLARDLGAEFSDTLKKVSAATRQRKVHYFGLDMFVFIWPMLVYLPHRMAVKGVRDNLEKEYKKGNWADTFTNMGTIDPAGVTFDHKPTEAILLPPPSYPPYCLLGASQYDGALTLSMAGYSAHRDISAKLLAAMANELASL